MATQCRIAFQNPDGSFRAVESHYDGYPSNMTLCLNVLRTKEDAENLVKHPWRSIHTGFGDWYLEGESFFSQKWHRERLEGQVVLEAFAEEELGTYCIDEETDDNYTFANLEDLLANKSKAGQELSVEFTYVFMQDGFWYGYWPYFEPKKGLIPIDNFIAHLNVHSLEHDGQTYDW